VSVSESTFQNNNALEGGAIYYECSLKRTCQVTISNSTFTNNIALTKGGAIMYTFYRPTLIKNTFTTNTASYGQNIASYPVKVSVKDSPDDSIELTNVGSGIVYATSITMALYDYDNQITSLENTSQIVLTGNSTGSSVLGINSKRVLGGQATFDSVEFISAPGAKNVIFNIVSPVVVLSKLRLAYGSDFSLNKINVDFRYCKPGEFISANT